MFTSDKEKKTEQASVYVAVTSDESNWIVSIYTEELDVPILKRRDLAERL
jgi:hypothetical protein